MSDLTHLEQYCLWSSRFNQRYLIILLKCSEFGYLLDEVNELLKMSIGSGKGEKCTYEDALGHDIGKVFDINRIDRYRFCLLRLSVFNVNNGQA